MKETLSTIADRTGFSQSTISRVLRGKARQYRIPESTEQTILKAVHSSGYTPRTYAQSLRNSDVKNIGLLVPSISNPYFADICSNIIDEARQHGYTTIVIDTHESEQWQNEGIDTLLSQHVDGIIVAPCGHSSVLLERINSEGTPVVLVDRHYEQSGLPYVTTNNFLGGYRATRLLVDQGHRSIACIQGARDSMPNRKRVEGYLAALMENGLEGRIVGNEFSINNGYFETKMLLNEVNPPTALFALSNTILLGMLKAIRESTLKIPADISILSFDDNLFLDYITPEITRIGQPVEEMSRLAARILFDIIISGNAMTNQIQLSPSIVAGASVLPPR